MWPDSTDDFSAMRVSSGYMLYSLHTHQANIYFDGFLLAEKKSPPGKMAVRSFVDPLLSRPEFSFSQPGASNVGNLDNTCTFLTVFRPDMPSAVRHFHGGIL